MKKVEFLDDSTVLVDGEKFIKEKPKSFSVGQWVIGKDGFLPNEVKRIKSIDGYFYTDDDMEEGDCNNFRFVRLATHAEIEAHLKAEAERRGYKEGVKVKSLYPKDKVLTLVDSKNAYYVGSNDCFWHNAGQNNALIYENGKWAEINKKELPKTREELVSVVENFLEKESSMQFAAIRFEDYLTKEGYV